MLKQLLDEFIKEDIALKVTFDNSELLVFTSTVLPEGFQRKSSYLYFVLIIAKMQLFLCVKFSHLIMYACSL